MKEKILNWVEFNFIKAMLLSTAITVLLLCGLVYAVAHASSATVSWTHPTQYTDGSALPLSGIASTRVEYGSCVGTAFGTKTGEVVVVAPAVTTTVTGLTPSTWCFRAYTKTTAAAGGLESGPSGVASKVIPFPAPNPPVLSTVITVVYDIQQRRYGWMVARRVGTVPLGVECNPEQVVLNRGYYEVPLDKVDLTRMPRSIIVVSKCEAS